MWWWCLGWLNYILYWCLFLCQCLTHPSRPIYNVWCISAFCGYAQPFWFLMGSQWGVVVAKWSVTSENHWLMVCSTLDIWLFMSALVDSMKLHILGCNFIAKGPILVLIILLRSIFMSTIIWSHSLVLICGGGWVAVVVVAVCVLMLLPLLFLWFIIHGDHCL